MSIRIRIAALVAALVLVEIASFAKLGSWLRWTSDPWLAYTSGVAFIALLLVSIIAMGSEISGSLRRQFYVGGLWLLVVQGLANVLMAYEHGLSALPVAVVSGFFNVPDDVSLKSMAIIQGATLSVVSISMWSVVGELLRSHWAHERQQEIDLGQFEEILKEVGND